MKKYLDILEAVKSDIRHECDELTANSQWSPDDIRWLIEEEYLKKKLQGKRGFTKVCQSH